MALEQIGAADVAGHGPHVPMPGHLHDAGEFDVALGGARHKPGPQTVAGEVVGLQPDLGGVALDDLGDGAVGEGGVAPDPS